ncbi:hypothetical protein DDQ45_24095 [Salmonella enterica]|nr:hypothetical protein [Salmonella enterica]EDR7525159.1 hypothetical protein [Salmonella enterica subsp. enterica serovar Oranienburg]EIM5533378.1 hypothetical protein [Salmonella enterica subsp. enterica]
MSEVFFFSAAGMQGRRWLSISVQWGRTQYDLFLYVVAGYRVQKKPGTHEPGAIIIGQRNI